jgi:4-hydroxy-3-methylbut-2-enyl diphosphate reductase LytB-like protein/phosphorylase superfamily protein
MPDLVVAAALWPEVLAVRRGLPPGSVWHVGLRARSAPSLAGARAVAMTGVAGALTDQLEPGDLVVATEVRSAAGVMPCPSAPLLAGELARLGLTVRLGPIFCADHLVHGAERTELAERGALAVDMESAVLASASGERPFAVVRAIVDTPSRPLLRVATVTGGVAGLRALTRVGPALSAWANAVAERRILLVGPRPFGAGVQRAVDVVDRLPDRRPGPVRDICHATANRQRAVLAVAGAADLVLVLGSANSANSRRLAEAAEREGTRALLVDQVGQVMLDWLARARTIGVCAGASAPPELVDELINALAGLGRLELTERETTTETIRFTLPEEVRP